MTTEKYQGIEDLELWKQSVDFASKVCCDLIPLLPSEEKYALASQIRRAVQSVPANIAEGYGRYYFQEGIRFTYLARGSLEEVYTQIVLTFRLGYISRELLNHYTAAIHDIRKLMNGYLAYLKRSKRGEKEPGNVYRISEPAFPFIVKSSDLESVDHDAEGNE